MEVQGVASLCYRRGWRDKNLITMVAIVGAESNYDENFNDGSKYGLFGLHAFTLGVPYHELLDPEYCSVVARERYETRHFALWISYATGRYLEHVKRSIEGVGTFYLTLYDIPNKCT